jgi:hypothetical protein
MVSLVLRLFPNRRRNHRILRKIGRNQPIHLLAGGGSPRPRSARGTGREVARSQARSAGRTAVMDSTRMALGRRGFLDCALCAQGIASNADSLVDSSAFIQRLWWFRFIASLLLAGFVAHHRALTSLLQVFAAWV